MICCICEYPIGDGIGHEMPDPYTGRPARSCEHCHDEGARQAELCALARHDAYYNRP